MKTRTQRLANIITIICALAVISIVIQVNQLSGPAPIRVIGELTLAIVMIASAQIMKRGSKVGWWVLVVCFSISTLGIICATIMGCRADIGLYAKVVVPLVLGMLTLLPLVLLLTDSPWKWTRSAA